MNRKPIIASALLVFAACSTESPEPVSQGERIPIEFNVDCAISQYAVSKAVAPVTNESLDSFRCCAARGEAGSSDTYAWTNVDFVRYTHAYTGGQYWPDSDPSYHFYASNAQMTANSGHAPTVTVTDARDIVCAYLPAGKFRSTNRLIFEHILSRVDEMTVTAQEGYTASDIHISLTPKTGGTYDILAGAGREDATGWSDITDGATYFPFSALSITTAGGTIHQSLNDLYLVPGLYDITASFTLSKGDYNLTRKNATGSLTIKKGKINTIRVGLKGGNASEIDLSIGVKEWGDPVNIDVTLQ